MSLLSRRHLSFGYNILQVKDNKEACILADTALGNISIMKRDLPEVKVLSRALTIFLVFICTVYSQLTRHAKHRLLTAAVHKALPAT